MKTIAAILVLAATACAAEPKVHRGLPYAEPGSELQTLDVYVPAEGKNLPVAVWIHGGGWHSGDKSEVDNKPQALLDKGFVLVSINYRLFPIVTIKQIAEDVAKAIRWISDHIAEYGGDPRRLVIMGHSAGAQLAALVCTDDRYLKAEGIPLSMVKACVPVDGDSYDVPMQILAVEVGSEASQTLTFGDPKKPAKQHTLTIVAKGKRAASCRLKFGDEAQQKELSAVTYVAKGKNIPPFLVLHVADHPETKAQSQRLVKALAEAGVPAAAYPAAEKNHMTLNADLGLPNDPATKELLAFLSFALGTAERAVVKATSLSTTDVQAALDAAQDGDTVQLPAGTATWSTNVTLKDKAVTLRGTGMDQTVIIDDIPSLWQEPEERRRPLLVVGVEGKRWRLTGLTFRGKPGGDPRIPQLVSVGGTCKNWRIDHCAFLESICAISVQDFTYGLIDHCDFRGTIKRTGGASGAVLGIQVGCDRHTAWSRPPTLGTAEALYIEDCLFDLSQGSRNFCPFHADQGARVVFRHCKSNAQIECCGTHDGFRGIVSFEIYDNVFGGRTRGGAHYPIALTGGTGVIFNNRFESGCFAEDTVFMRCYRNLGPKSVYVPGRETHYTKSKCDGGSIIDGNLPYDATATGKHTGGAKEATLTCADANWAPNRWAGLYVWNVTAQSRGKITANTANTVTAALEPVNIDDDKRVAFPEPQHARYTWEPGDVFKITNGYPCLDQIGRAPGTEEALGFKVQKSEPLYAWNNLVDGKTKLPFQADKVSTEYIKEGRDFFSDTPRPGYKPFQYPHPLQSAGD